METDISIDLLEQPPKTLTLLVYLYKYGSSYKSELKKELGVARQTIYNAADRLKELDLIFEKKERGFPQKAHLHLTQQGRKLAESLVSVNEIIGETIKGFEKKLELLRKGEETAESIKEMADIICRLAEISFARGRWDQAVTLSTECGALSKDLEDHPKDARSNWILGEIKRRRGEVVVAIEHFQKSSELFTRLDDKGGLSTVHYSLGAISERKGDLASAFSEYRKSEDYAKEADHEISQAKAMLGVGRVLGRRGQYEKSYRELMKAIRLLEKIDALEELSIGYGNLGSTTSFLDVDEAMGWFKKSIEVAESVGDLKMIGSGWMNLAGCHIRKSEYKPALEDLNRAKEIIVELDDKKMLSSLYIQFGLTYTGRRTWTRARKSFERAIDLAEQNGLRYHLADALFNLALVDASISSTERASERLQRAKRIFEELENEDKARAVEEELKKIS
ncbi:MAG: hypothetical protein KAR39_08850 [Thermoplasmata archaeon]|nr:hypothetical protein [Thermoplasmata archaeon]